MNFNEYQQEALKTAQFPIIGHKCIYPALGLSNEAGEVLGKLKKIFRDNNGIFTDNHIENIKSELSDCLWYLAVLSDCFSIPFNDVAKHNIEKLQSRQLRGTIHGDGDNR